MSRLRVLGVLVAVLAAGCGEEAPATRPAAPEGRLVVVKALPDGPIFIEGSVTHLRVTGPDGEVVVDGLRPVETLGEPVLDRPLAPGAYAVSAVERPCSGTCDHLDPPFAATRCDTEVEVRPGATTRLELALHRSGDDVVPGCAARPSNVPRAAS